MLTNAVSRKRSNDGETTRSYYGESEGTGVIDDDCSGDKREDDCYEKMIDCVEEGRGSGEGANTRPIDFADSTVGSGRTGWSPGSSGLVWLEENGVKKRSMICGGQNGRESK